MPFWLYRADCMGQDGGGCMRSAGFAFCGFGPEGSDNIHRRCGRIRCRRPLSCQKRYSNNPQQVARHRVGGFFVLQKA